MNARNANPTRGPLVLAALACCLAVPPLDGAAQEARPRTVVTAAGERYRAGPLHRLVLGRHYRDLWTTPMEVEVLDLSTFAGGLEPLRTGGGRQTRSLRFLGADGREYSFRSVDKDPSAVLDSLFWDTFIDDLVQDGISAAHPLGALVAAPLLDAAGVLHVDPRLRVMPDDPALGEFREEFAGMLGLIEERPNENQGGESSFRGAVSIIASPTLTERLDEGPADRVDARAFLTARLMDVFLGDWDRHRGQWRWATYAAEGEPRAWLPVPTDRDQAFSKFDGIAPRLVSLYMPQFVRFDEDYPAIERLHWNGRALDRWFLSELERPVWDSIGAVLQERLDDTVIDEAVRRLPPEIHAQNGEELAHALRARRDDLDQALDAFYRLLARQVDVRATDADEVVAVDRGQAGRITVSMTAPEHGDEPYFRRSFHADETQEIRIYLGGGDDRVSVRGSANTDTRVRIIGGPGDDVFDVPGSPRGISLYDSRGDNVVSGSAGLEEKHFEEWVWTEEDRDQPRDWGRRTTPIFWTRYSSDLGLFLGGGVRVERFAFRKHPYSTGMGIRGGFSFSESKGRVEMDTRVYRENSRVFGMFGARYSGLDVINYHGLGNDSPAAGGDFNKVDHQAASLTSTLGVEAGGLEASAGLVLSWMQTAENAGRFFATVADSLYGAEDFLELGATARLVYDPTADSETAASRVRVSLGGTAFPGYFTDVERSFARTDAQLSVLLASSPTPVVSLALRGGTEQVWGRFPWSEAAFLGGSSTLRGWDEQRFAGEVSVFLSTELRLRLGHPRVVVPVSMGGFGFWDVGRVYLHGASPGGWHGSVGGGIWLQPVGQPYMLRWGVGVGDETTRVYLALGLPY